MFFERMLIDEGSPVDIIFLDFQKAFDNVLHHQKNFIYLVTHICITLRAISRQ